ncbi:TPA: TRAP transporter small permease subunit, partial [Shigella flexneri]|nr:TRAP transporter small permease subunit [Shigella flexneri]
MIFNRLKLAVDRVIATFSVAVMLALVVCVVWQVFSRYVLNQPSTLTDELARFLMIWVGLLGAAY